jgi:hypothetical protein
MNYINQTVSQPGLPLVGGFHAGPLFVTQIVKPPRVRQSGGKEVWAKYKRAKPPWVTWAECNVFWDESARKTAETGIQHSVDHIVPLIHPLVCGLHAPANFRVCPLADNQRKSNKWWPDMWMEQIEMDV